MDFRQLAKLSVKYFLHVLFPVSCPICGNLGETACSECLGTLCFNREFKCFECGLDYPCVLHESNTWVYYYARHYGMARELLLSLKYRNQESLGRAMGECIAKALLRDSEKQISSYDVGSVILIPIPLHRDSNRRFNQSSAIASGISRVLGFRVSEALRWSFDVEAQTERSGKERYKLAVDAFKADSRIAGKKVIIVDDVLTTGTTLKRALSACEAAGAEGTGVIVWTKS
jgi:ComF family protein